MLLFTLRQLVSLGEPGRVHVRQHSVRDLVDQQAQPALKDVVDLMSQSVNQDPCREEKDSPENSQTVEDPESKLRVCGAKQENRELFEARTASFLRQKRPEAAPTGGDATVTTVTVMATRAPSL